MEVQLKLKHFVLIILLVICTTQTSIDQRRNECHLDNTCLNDGSCRCDCNYTKTSCGQNIFCSNNWTYPHKWPTERYPVIYRDFENTLCLKLVNGARIVPGKASKAVSTDHKLKQWVDLGSLEDACLTQPKTCGLKGASLSMWLKIEHCGMFNTIISTSSNNSGGFMVFCGSSNDIIICVDDKSGIFNVSTNKANGWTYLVLTYNEGVGIKVFNNVSTLKKDTTRDEGSIQSGNGHVTIGTHVTNETDEQFYASVKVDELTFWNHTLSLADIANIYNVYCKGCPVYLYQE